MTLKIALATLAALFTFASTSYAAGGPSACVNNALDVVSDYEAGEVRVTFVESIKTPRGPARGYIVWMRSSLCEKGYIVTKHDTHCNVRQLFSRGGCQIEGMRYFPY